MFGRDFFSSVFVIIVLFEKLLVRLPYNTEYRAYALG